ncbi:MAG: cytochrome P450 [Sphingomonadaceae bacterium]
MSQITEVWTSGDLPEERIVDFDIYAPPGARDDYHAAWQMLADKADLGLVWSRHNGGHWIPTRVDVLEQVMADYKCFSLSAQTIPKSVTGDIKLLPTVLDPPEHRPYRILLNELLSPRAVRDMEPLVREEARSLIDAFATRGSCDFIHEYAEKLPIHVFLRLVDLPLSDAPLLKTWSDTMLRPPPDVDWGVDKTAFAYGVRMFFDYLDPVIRARRNGPGQDVITRLVSNKIDGRDLTHSEALQLSVQLLIAGLDTVVNALGFIFLFLAKDETKRAELTRNPGLIPVAVEELLRRHPIVVVAREVTHDFEMCGVMLRKGEQVCVATPIGAVDESDARCPMTVDFSRPRKKHISFGTGDHRCPGAHLARAELRITIEEWLRRIPDFRVAQDCDVSFTGGIVAVVDELVLNWGTAGTPPQ